MMILEILYISAKTASHSKLQANSHELATHPLQDY